MAWPNLFNFKFNNYSDAANKVGCSSSPVLTSGLNFHYVKRLLSMSDGRKGVPPLAAGGTFWFPRMGESACERKRRHGGKVQPSLRGVKNRLRF